MLLAAFLGANCRLRKRSEYLAVQSAGRQVNSRRFIVLVAPGDSRVGITVSRKVGNAVARNRIKRLVREFVRQNRDWVPKGKDVVVIAKRSAAKATWLDVCADLGRTGAGIASA